MIGGLLSRPPFVGREHELTRLQPILDAAVSGHGRLLLVSGEPGIGKTRFAEELESRARRRGMAAHWGSGVEDGGAPAFLPWMQVLRAVTHEYDKEALRAAAGRGADDLALVLPELRMRLPEVGDLPAPGDSPQLRFRLFDSITSFLVHIALKQPLLLVFDDLHCADRPSLLLLEHLAREIRHAPLLIVATYRDVPSKENPLILTLCELGRMTSTVRLQLRGLTANELARLIEVTAGVHAPALSAALHRETEGNPFFTTEVLRPLIANGQLTGTPAAKLAIPATVREAINRGLGPLSQECCDVLAIAAVIGREFDADLLHRVLGVRAATLADAIDEAMAAQVINEASPGRYRFSHALARQTLYEHLTATDRKRWHEQVAAAVETASGGETRSAELAYHFAAAAELGGNSEKAVTYGRQAGDAALAALAYEEAARLYEIALREMARSGANSGRPRAELLLNLGRAQERLGYREAALASYEVATEIARTHGLPDLLARIAVAMSDVSYYPEPSPLATGLLYEALERLGEDAPERPLVQASLAFRLVWTDLPQAQHLARRAVVLGRRVNRGGLPTVLKHAHVVLWGPDAQPEERLALTAELEEIGRKAANREMIAEAALRRLFDLLILGDIERAQRESRAYATLAHELGDANHRWYAAIFAIIVGILQGRFSEAESMIEHALAATENPPPFLVDEVRRMRSAIHIARGDFVECERVATQTDMHSPFAAATALAARIGQAYLCSEAGRMADARREFEELARDEFVGVVRYMNWHTNIALLAIVCARVGDVRRAAILYDLLQPHEGRCVAAGVPIVGVGAVSRFLGLLATTLLRWQDAERHFEAAVAMNARMGAEPALAYTRYDYAAMLLARGCPQDLLVAQELLRAAGETAHALGMKPLAERVAACEQNDHSPMAARERAPDVAVRKSTSPPRASASLRPEGDYWSIGFAGDILRLKDSKGLHYLACLLPHPGRAFHALDLVQSSFVLNRQPPRKRQIGGSEPLLDPKARAEYTRQLGELREELDEAELFNDLGRLGRAREQTECMTHELAAALGLDGRARKTAAPAERARLLVTQRIKATLKRIREHRPALAQHLATSIKTGYFCAYTPDPLHPIRWLTGLVLAFIGQALLDDPAGLLFLGDF